MARSPRVSGRIDRILSWNGTRPWTRARLSALVGAALSLAILAAACQFVARNGDGDTAIEGQVLDSQTNRPIAGAQVVLKPTRLPFQDGSWDSLETETAADGTFAFHVEGPVTFQLTAAHEKYVNPDPPWDSDAPSFEADEGARPARTLLRLDPGYIVRGRVVADTGEPVPGMGVVALPPEAEMFMDRETTDPVKEAATGPDGRYEIRGLAAGDYRIEARQTFSPTLETAAREGVFRPVSLSIQRAGHVAFAKADAEVLPDPTLVAEVNLSAQPLPNSEIRGRILSDGEADGLRVTLVLSGRGGLSFVAEDGILVGNEYRITGLAPGTYRLTATAPSDDPADRLRASAEVLLDERPLGQDLVLVGTTRIHGRVIVEGGEVADNWEVGLAIRRDEVGMSITLRPMSLDVGDGSFTMEGVFPGRYGVVLQNTRGFNLTGVRFDGQATDGNQIVVPAGAAEHELEVLLEPND